MNKKELKSNIEINLDERVIFCGVDGEDFKTLGTSYVKLMNNDNFKCKFHILENPLRNVPADGILGLDVLKYFNAIIDIEKEKIKFKNNTKILELSLIGEFPFSMTKPGSNSDNSLSRAPIADINGHICRNEIIEGNILPKEDKCLELVYITPGEKRKNRNDKIKSKESNMVNMIEKDRKSAKKFGSDSSIGSSSAQTNYTQIEQIKEKEFKNDLKLEKLVKSEREMNKTKLKDKEDKIIIEARTHKNVNLIMPGIEENREIIIFSQEIEEGLYVANTLNKIEKGKAVINIINSNTYDVVINMNKFKLHYDFYDKFYSLNVNEKKEEIKPSYNKERVDKLVKLIKTDENLDKKQKQYLMDLIIDYNDVFNVEGDKLSFTDDIYHIIRTPVDSIPIHQKNYRLPQSQTEVIQDEVKKLIKDDIITLSKSPWNSPLLVVPKKPGPNNEKRFRMVIDYRKLNKITIGDAFPLPRIEDILDQLGNARYFSTLDLASGYHQVLVHPNDRAKTAFSTNTGHYEFKRMPFGLTGAPATFQRLMNYVLTGLQGLSCYVYLDDIVIYGKDINDHNRKLKLVFDRLRKHNLKLQTEKCNFLCKQVTFLGHVCTQDGVRPNPELVRVVKDFPQPTKVKELQSFLGLANYYRKFIQNFSKIAEPLNKLLRNNEKFVWSKKCQDTFEKLKHCLINKPILQYPDFTKPFVITSDASNEALGAILSQGEGKNDLPIAYASRCLNPTERSYNTTEKELLAIVWACQTFKCYIFGRPFTVYTDHEALHGQLNLIDPTRRAIRLYFKLADYDITIKHKAGKQIAHADALSRIPYEIENEKIMVTTRSQKIKQVEEVNKKLNDEKSSNKQKKDLKEKVQENISNESDYESENEIEEFSDEEINNNKLDSSIQQLNTKEEIEEVLDKYHNSLLGGHQGVKKTYDKIKKDFCWKGMSKDISEFVSKCIICQKNKSKKSTKMPMMITKISEEVFDKIYIDIVGPLPITYGGNRYILTIIDDLSRFFDAYAIPNAEANTVAKIFCEEFICRYRIPKVVVSDQGSNFMSQVFKKCCKFLNIKKLETTAYHPQANGILERSHGPLKAYLRSFSQHDQLNWDNFIRSAVFVHNNTQHSGSKITPNDCLFGFTAQIPTNIKKQPTPVYNTEDYFYELSNKLRTARQIARENLSKSKEKSKHYYDNYTNPLSLKIGDKVLIKNEAKKNSLDETYKGPYEVIEINNDLNTTIQIKNKNVKVHNNRLKKFFS